MRHRFRPTLLLAIYSPTALLVGIAFCADALAQPTPDPLPVPYPATATPEALPFELGVPTLAPTSDVVEKPAEDTIDLEVAAPDEPRWYSPTYWFGPTGWDTAIELGLNGSSGTSESMSLRTGGYIKRETEYRKIDFDLYHNRTRAAGIETQNNAQASFRHDWLLADSPWSVYLQSQLYYDEFQAFDLNLNVNSGIGYQFIDTDWTDLTGRIGAGASREFGGPNDDWVPEAQFGIDFEQKMSETQKFTTTIDYYPEFENFNRYRLLTDIGYEVELMVPSNVSLKIAATNRYDSSPDGVDPNNLNYSVLLLWKL